jgi:GTP-binding protein
MTKKIELKKQYILLDSVGIRRPSQRTVGVETFATFQTIETVQKADVVCLVFDGTEPLAHQDQLIAGIAKEAKKGIVVIINKIDEMSEQDKAAILKQFHHKFAFLKIQNTAWVSAKTGENLFEIWNAVDNAVEEQKKVISVEEMRKLFNYLMKQRPPKKLKLKKKPIVYDFVFVKSSPLTFELLVKDKTCVHWSYIRFLENVVRQNFGFANNQISIKVTDVEKKKIMV